ncbi:haloacid dehalogenase type II [Roseomonas frigidaquae]|uniref:Haloacid dehalogenase type II n=1 Tax=Falsiroseomonas frigidaquae TaxID=487318 RepID=A0ABX1EU36_9PROT|nr:haloacid dehalogenase type II [Falsiroseomonas frigidaquae]NKE44040.1 haloacid dehalogenase type II [Falsiroseomonas frigidaquae]
MQLSDFRILTFDCYGTLIDWEGGIHAALQPLLASAGTAIGREAALQAFARLEADQEALTPDMIYSDLLAEVHRRLAREWNVPMDEAAHRRFGASVPDWPAFPDSAEALAYLKRHFKLVILSNVDRTSFAGSNRRLGVEFDAIYTAQDIGSYKPSDRNFTYMLEKLAALGHGKGEILHTAQSLFHDHAPARRAGLATAWIDRRHDQDGWGATPPAEAGHDFRFTSLAALAAAHAAERQS